MAASVDHMLLVGHAGSWVMHTPCWCIGREETDTQKTRKQTSASDGRRNGEDRKGEDAGCEVDEEAHVVVHAFEASPVRRVVGETVVDADEEAEHSEEGCAKVV